MSGAVVNPIVITDKLSGDVYWQMALDVTEGGVYGSGLGIALLGVSDIEQCIRIIMTTLPGTDPLRPTFGLNYLRFLDQPISLAAPLIVGLTVLALETWEPRISIVSVVPYSTQSSSIGVDITWAFKGQSASNTTTVVVGG